MVFFDEEGNFLPVMNEWVEKTAVTGDWGMLLQRVCTYVSSSHTNLLEQKVFTKEELKSPTGLANTAAISVF